MAIFAVLLEKPNTDLGTKIATLFPTDHYQLTPTQWFISADTIPHTLGEQLGLRKGEYGSVAVVSAIVSAAGYHKTSFWEWVRQKGGEA